MKQGLVVASLIQAVSIAFAVAAEPPELLDLAKAAPQPPWPAGDERGMANTLGNASTQRCAWHMAQAQAKWFEASHVRSNSMPKTPFGGPGGTRHKPSAGIPFSRHAFNSEVFEAEAEPGQQGTQIDALGHFGALKNPWDPKKRAGRRRDHLLRRFHAEGGEADAGLGPAETGARKDSAAGHERGRA